MWLRARGPTTDRWASLETLSRRAIILRQDAFLVHDALRVLSGHDQIEQRLSGPRFAQRPVHDFGRRSAPVVDGNTGFLLKYFLQRLEDVRLHRPVNDQLAVFPGGFDELGVLGDGNLGEK